MALKCINADSQTIATAAPVNSTSTDLRSANGFFAVNRVTVNTPAPATFTAVAATDVCTATAHGGLTGLLVRVSTTTTLPGGLAAATDYFMIVIDANSFKLATSLANAQAGTAIDITTTGTGTHTFTPTALATASYKLQGSVDNVTWDDLGVSNNITVTATFTYEKVDPMYNFLRASYTLASGQISVVRSVTVKGN